jgi:hypothetical protein
MTVRPSWQAQVLPLVLKGRTVPQIAHDLGVSTSAVWALCCRRGWKPQLCHLGRRGNPRILDYRSDDMADFDEMSL